MCSKTTFIYFWTPSYRLCYTKIHKHSFHYPKWNITPVFFPPIVFSRKLHTLLYLLFNYFPTCTLQYLSFPFVSYITFPSFAFTFWKTKIFFRLLTSHFVLDTTYHTHTFRYNLIHHLQYKWLLTWTPSLKLTPNNLSNSVHYSVLPLFYGLWAVNT